MEQQGCFISSLFLTKSYSASMDTLSLNFARQMSTSWSRSKASGSKVKDRDAIRKGPTAVEKTVVCNDRLYD